MFGRNKSANKACKNTNVEAEKEATSSRKSSTSSKQQSKTCCCGKNSNSTKACK